jgi:hypothetical protein
MARQDVGTALWTGNIQAAPLGNVIRGSNATVWRFANELSGPGGRTTQVVQDPVVTGLTGSKTIKSTLDLTGGLKGGIRHFDEAAIDNNADHIMEIWYYVPQLITNVGWNVMMMQWKQNYNDWVGYWPSHVVNAVYLRYRNGANYVVTSKGEGSSWGIPTSSSNYKSHPTKNIPINGWFGIKSRYIRSNPGVANGRFTTWQIDLDGTHTLIGDHQNIVTYWNQTGAGQTTLNFSGQMLRAGYALYAENTTPAIITSYHDKVKISLPADISGVGEVAPTGTVTIGSILVNETSATIPYSYNNSDQTGYQYRLNGGNIIISTSSPVQLTGLVASTSYTIEIRAINTVGVGAWSTVTNFTTSNQSTSNPIAPSSYVKIKTVGGFTEISGKIKVSGGFIYI